jgi:hypothetical protein
MVITNLSKTRQKRVIFSLTPQHPPILSAKPLPSAPTEGRNCGTGLFPIFQPEIEAFDEGSAASPDSTILNHSEKAKIGYETMLILPTLKSQNFCIQNRRLHPLPPPKISQNRAFRQHTREVASSAPPTRQQPAVFTA